jgi:hypothetical protein
MEARAVDGSTGADSEEPCQGWIVRGGRSLDQQGRGTGYAPRKSATTSSQRRPRRARRGQECLEALPQLDGGGEIPG